MRPGRGAALAAGALLLGCPPRPDPPSPAGSPSTAPAARSSAMTTPPGPFLETPLASPPLHGTSLPLSPGAPAEPRCRGLQSAPRHPGYLAARCDERASLLLLATREEPQRHRPPVALFRLAEALGVRVVPRTEARELTLRELLDGAEDEETRRWIGAEAAVKPGGTVSAAVIQLPGLTRTRATRWSNEEQRWTRLAESAEALPPQQQAQAEDWVALLTLDYLAGAILRRSVEEDEAGRLWLLDNQGTFLERPEPYAVDQLLGRLKRCRQWPEGLRGRLERLDEGELERRLRSGEYEAWLVHRRALQEVGVRRRALAAWLAASAAQ